MRNNAKICMWLCGIAFFIFLSGCKREEAVVEETVIPEEAEEKTVPQRDYQLYIAVPIQYMSMRTEPDFAAEAVTRIYPETLLKKAGEPVISNDTEFYCLSTLDGAYTGYCAANYCIAVSCEYDKAALTIVDTSDAVYTYGEMEEDLKEMAERYPDHIHLDSIGQSVEGRELYRVILGNPNAPVKYLIQGSIHGREYMSTQIVMKMLEYYAADYETGYYGDKFYTELFENTCFHIIPMSNPDGVSISQEGERAVSSEETIEMMRTAYERDKETLIHAVDSNGDPYWYDTYANPDYDRYAEGYDEIITYEEYLKQWKANANGVDINRNFSAGWEEIRQKEEPGFESFKGYMPDSEPETQALKAVVESNDFEAVISYHARGQLIYYDAAGNSSEMSEESRRLSESVAELIRYQPVNCKDAANVVLGGFGDWAMLSRDITSITIEMGKRPCPVGSEEFTSIWNRNRELWAKIASEYYQ